jgi:hypothetical protein
MKRETSSSPPRGGICWHYPLLILVVGGSMASCFLQTKASDQKTKPQEWRESRGPVIPHDSFPRDCTICHVKGSWHEIRSDFVFDHAKETGTPLTGAHQVAQCLRCHNDRGSVATFSKRGCTGCHEDIHRGRLGIKCTTCHNDTDWNPTGIYAVHAQTRFPLQGVHVGVSCSRCHPSAEAGQFLGADPRCEACHRQDALSAKSMDHAAQGLLSNCQQCHSQGTWSDARFNHAGITTGCVKCHQNDYNRTTNPNHTTSGFPTNCEACHNTSSWSGATFNHTYFPVNHGNANGTCAKCHPNPANYRTFDCLACHPRNSELDSHHTSNLSTYYQNSECYRCHPQGRAGKTIVPLLKQQKK